MPSPLPSLSPLHAAIFSARCAGEPDDRVAARLGLTPQDFLQALYHPDLQLYLRLRRIDKALTQLESQLAAPQNPTEGRRAATTLLRFFRTPPTTRPAAETSPTAAPPAPSALGARRSPPPAQDPGPQDSSSPLPTGRRDTSAPPPALPPAALAAAAGACATGLETLRANSFPAHTRLCIFYNHITPAWRGAHGHADQFARNSDSPHCFFAPLVGHRSLTLGTPRPDPCLPQQVNVPVHVHEPSEARFEAHMTRQPDDTWLISALQTARPP